MPDPAPIAAPKGQGLRAAQGEQLEEQLEADKISPSRTGFLSPSSPRGRQLPLSGFPLSGHPGLGPQPSPRQPS